MVAAVMSHRVYDALLPRLEVRSVDWAEGNLPAPPPIKGKMRFDLFPYMREPLDCMDDPHYSRVTIQAAARTGKTTGAQAFVLRIVRFNPHEICWADVDEHSTKRVIRRTWKIAEGCDDLAGQVPPRRLQAAGEMQFVDCTVHGAWSGSVSKSADAAFFAVVKNELDKFSIRKRRGEDGGDVGEADFADLIDERVIGFVGATIVEISTPTVTETSRIEHSRLAGDNRAFFVPCPHCNAWQTLRSGDGREPGGLRWDKNADGRSDPDIARDTAWYECRACRRKILDDHRYEMVNAGRYVREGQTLDAAGRIRGKPARAGNHASFGPIGRHYSLLPGITWGSMAAQYVAAKQDKSGSKWRHYLNSVEGVTWSPKPATLEPNIIARRLRGDTDRGVCPEWSAFVTIAADVGTIGERFYFYWMAVAWGSTAANVPTRRGQVLDWGIAAGEAEFLNVLAAAEYAHADGGPPLRWCKGGVDTGYQGRGNDDNAIYSLCDSVNGLVPLKGSSASLGADYFAWGFKRSDTTRRELRLKRKLNIGDLFLINTPLSQSWRSNLIAGRTPRDGEEFCGLPADVCDDWETHADLFAEIKADVLIDGRWENLGQPNEAGDLLRYNRCLAEYHTGGGKRWGSLKRDEFDSGSGERKTWFAENKKRKRR